MDIVERIEEALEGIRPYIASHKGSVEVIDFDPVEGHLLLRMGGTCQGCAAATITLNHGIETRPKQSVPEVRTVEAV